eukprot:GDKH01000560.1.p1 GENE.GDKH01000560.1~~GDKH01000560.1.p1  ORF type:complete len:97 (-),score=26.17 GDKH01000560.1:164-454(-)
MSEDFDLAVKFVKQMPSDGQQPTNDDKLNFYKYFKQATQGDVTGDQPWAVQMEARAKWDAWNSVKGMSSDDAKAKYIEALASARPTWKDEAKAAGL